METGPHPPTRNGVLTKSYLLTPGPTMVPPSVLAALARPIIHHRTAAYRELFGRVSEGLQRVFQTQHPVLSFAASGTGAMEAAVVNLLSPGDRVAVVRGGVFGERWGLICERYGITVDWVEVEWGQAVDPQALAEALRRHPDTRVVYATLCETSTGVRHDVQALARVVAPTPAVLAVDAISGLLADDLPMDAWGVDVVVSGSQKGFMLPPGLAFAALSPKAWARVQRATLPRFYFDVSAMRKGVEALSSPFTPAISLMVGLEESLRLIDAEGLPAVLARHARLARATRAAMDAMGLERFARASPSNVVTSVLVPRGIEGNTLTTMLADRFGVTVAGGQGKLKGKIFRIANLGYTTATDILVAVSCLEMALTALGVRISAGVGTRAVQQVVEDAR